MSCQLCETHILQSSGHCRPVAHIEVADGMAKGVTFTDGRRLQAKAVVVSADPFRLQQLLEPGDLPPQLNTQLDSQKIDGSVLKVRLGPASMKVAEGSLDSLSRVKGNAQHASRTAGEPGAQRAAGVQLPAAAGGPASHHHAPAAGRGRHRQLHGPGAPRLVVSRAADRQGTDMGTGHT